MNIIRWVNYGEVGQAGYVLEGLRDDCRSGWYLSEYWIELGVETWYEVNN